MDQKVALVTGASAGMGKDFARALAQEGLIVYAAARRLSEMNDLRQLGIHPIKMDITKEQDIAHCVEVILAEHGQIDVLVNNAGFGLCGAVEDITLEEARYQFEVNLFGLAALTKKVLPGMRERRSGKIINISSIGGKIYSPLGAWYHATKHALEGWSDCLRLEVSQFGIDVVIVEPGAINTEFGNVMTQPMLDRSGHGSYAAMTRKMAKLQDEQYVEAKGSPPQVITDLILQAVKAKKPKNPLCSRKVRILDAVCPQVV